jgi:hypothetical protein
MGHIENVTSAFTGAAMNVYDNTSKAEAKFAILSKLMEFKPKVQSALDRQEGEGFTFDMVFDLVVNGKVSFFWNETTCVFLEFRVYPEGAHAHVFLAAGDINGLHELFSWLGPWAKSQGAIRATTLCRKGFKRALRKSGWVETQVWLTKEL